MILMREELGEVLKDYRNKRGLTLRQTSQRSSVALGYISELERGQKEASSEILQALADALQIPLSQILTELANRLYLFEEFEPGVEIPDIVPDDLLRERG